MVLDQKALTTPLLAGFEISRYVDQPPDPFRSDKLKQKKADDSRHLSDRINEDEEDLRVYLYPDRHPKGSNKLGQRRPYDIFSLGLVLIEIGL